MTKKRNQAKLNDEENGGEPRKGELAAQIRNVFSKSRYPGHDNLVWYTDSRHHPKCRFLKELVKGKRWPNVKREKLLKAKNHLSFFSTKGFHHYLPAFMLLVIDYSPAEMMTVDSLVSRLLLPREVDITETIEKANLLRLRKKWPQFDFDAHFNAERSNLAKRVKDFIDLTTCFSFDQAKVVYNFLAYIEHVYAGESQHMVETPRKAIDRFWHLFGDKEKADQPKV